MEPGTPPEKVAPPPAEPAPPPAPPPLAPTPLWWRLVIAAAVVLLAVLAYLVQPWAGPRGQAAFGICCFLGVAACVSANLRAVSWRTLGAGIAVQFLLALFVIKFTVFGYRPGYELFNAVAQAMKQFLDFTREGSKFVFGGLTDQAFAFSVLPTIIFVASFFSVLYHLGVLQFVVRLMARAMMFLMRTSGAESLSAAANVFMGQTEAPLIIRPYVERMTQSELLAVMVGGMATISGSLMAAYIGMGADPVSILATSVMAAPCSLYLAKLVLPETATPETRGTVQTVPGERHGNVIDAAAAGATDGLKLALNVAAVLIAALAFIAMFDYLLGQLAHGLNQANARAGGVFPGQVELSLKLIFSKVFAPVAFLMGVEGPDVGRVGNLLGVKLVGNEFLAYAEFQQQADQLSPRTRILTTYALTGFANFSSIGIQIGGIGAMAPSRRSDLARLGPRALLAGFLATLVNASVAGLFVDV